MTRKFRSQSADLSETGSCQRELDDTTATANDQQSAVYKCDKLCTANKNTASLTLLRINPNTCISGEDIWPRVGCPVFGSPCTWKRKLCGNAHAPRSVKPIGFVDRSSTTSGLLIFQRIHRVAADPASGQRSTVRPPTGVEPLHKHRRWSPRAPYMEPYLYTGL